MYLLYCIFIFTMVVTHFLTNIINIVVHFEIYLSITVTTLLVHINKSYFFVWWNLSVFRNTRILASFPTLFTHNYHFWMVPANKLLTGVAFHLRPLILTSAARHTPTPFLHWRFVCILMQFLFWRFVQLQKCFDVWG